MRRNRNNKGRVHFKDAKRKQISERQRNRRASDQGRFDRRRGKDGKQDGPAMARARKWLSAVLAKGKPSRVVLITAADQS